MCSRVHLVVSVPYKIWNRVEHNLSESLHDSPPITMLLSLSPVKINGLIITASDTVCSLHFPRLHQSGCLMGTHYVS